MQSHSLRAISLFAISAIALAISSCSNTDESTIRGVGKLVLTFEYEKYLQNADGTTSGIESPFAPVTDDLSLTMVDKSGRYNHTWESLMDFPQDDDYFAGTYELTVKSRAEGIEGFDAPAYFAQKLVEVKNGGRTAETIEIRLSNSLVRAKFTEAATKAFADVAAIFHTEGGAYFTVNPTETRYLCLNPGATELLISVTPEGGTPATVQVSSALDLKAAVLYEYTVDATADDLIISSSALSQPISLPIKAITSDKAPTATTSWNPEVTLYLPEGDTPTTPYVATFDGSEAAMAHLYLSATSASLKDENFPSQVDLLNLSADEATRLRALGLEFTASATAATVDLTKLLGNLDYLSAENAVSTFSLLAVSASGNACQPVALTVETTQVGIDIEASTSAVMGVDIATVTIACDQPGFEQNIEVEILGDNGQWTKAEITGIETVADGRHLISFRLPYGSKNVDARVVYCEEPRGSFTVERTMPEFSILVDAFAHGAMVKVNAADESLMPVITENVIIYVDDVAVPAYNRQPSTGELVVMRLNPSTNYKFKATLKQGVSDIPFTPVVEVRTESMPQLPNADFEDRLKGPRYDHLPSGGKYSQTTVEIFNWQHFTDIDTEVPKGWATVNAKTFNTASNDPNTWYMQTSGVATRNDAASGTYSVMLTSVAFDTKGKPIPNYLQTGQPYLDYSPVVPEIAYHAAGKLFLGSYGFDPESLTENYDEGVSWSARPRSLNGYYKFLPSDVNLSASGLVVIEVLGEVDGVETVIAQSRFNLPIAATFTAFSVPLEYKLFGVKAKKLKLMFASSTEIGNIMEETARIITYPDPHTASSVGGKLWIDNLSFAY